MNFGIPIIPGMTFETIMRGAAQSGLILNAIIGYSEMLLEEAQVSGQEGHVKDLLKIRSSAVHLLSIINEILGLSKIEAGRMELEAIDLFGMS